MSKYKNQRRTFKFVWLWVFLCLCISLFGCEKNEQHAAARVAQGELEIYYLDVGQGDAALLRSEEKAMMIDAGNRDDSGMILNELKNLGIDELECIVFTHPHEDHIGSGKAIVQNIDVKKVYMLDGYDEGIALDLKDTIKAAGITVEEPTPGESQSFGECEFSFLGPIKEYTEKNNNSICVKVIHGSNSVLFTGDTGRTAEKDLVDSDTDLGADIFQAGHHGSENANSYYLLKQVNPKYAVISCGQDNKYGHPDEAALSRFNDVGAMIYRTDELGTIVVRSDGKEITFNCEGKQPTRAHTEEQEAASYIGNVNSEKFHLPSCSALPKEDNRSYFGSRAAAVEAGYDPCQRCKP